jgi:SnoaL-like protein
MEMWELVARESIRDRIARWNAKGDAGKLTEMVEVLAPDVEFQAANSPVLHGRDAVLAFLGSVHEEGASTGRYLPQGARPSIRHFTGTTQIDFTSQTTATVRTYYAVLSSFGLDHWGRYLDEFSLVDGSWLISRRTVTTDGIDPEGWAASLR